VGVHRVVWRQVVPAANPFCPLPAPCRQEIRRFLPVRALHKALPRKE